MNILEIYHQYQIMPQLAEHQLRVAAVGQMICDHLTPALTSDERTQIISACLLHDMGNIAKFNFDAESLAKMPGLVDPVTIPHWEEVKQEFLTKFGSGSHNVTMKIISELGVSNRVKELVDCVGFSQGVDNAAISDMGKKICAYSDMRVMPLGLASLEQRMADLRLRYQHHKEDSRRRDEFENALRQIEQQIFQHCNIKPEGITEGSIAEIKEVLKSFEI